MSAPCRFFNTPKGCAYGDQCRFLHIASDIPICKYFNTPTGCIYGTNCYYKHQYEYVPEPIRIKEFKSNKTNTIAKLTNVENRVDAVDSHLDRKVSAEYVVFGECRKHYNIIPYDIANIIIQFYFIECEYLAIFHATSEQINFFGIDPVIRSPQNVKNNILSNVDDINEALYALGYSNNPFFMNLFPKHAKYENNHILIRVQEYDVDTDDIKEDAIGNYAYCIETEEIINLPSMRQKKNSQEIVYTPNHGIFIIGGCEMVRFEGYNDMVDETQTIHQLIIDSNNNNNNTDTMKWKECKNMNNTRERCRAIVINNNKIVIHGGLNENSMELFDINNDSMINLSCSDVDRGWHGMHYAHHLNAIFVVGGTNELDDNQSPCNSVEIYDTTKDFWRKMPNAHNNYEYLPFLDTKDNLLYVISNLDLNQDRCIFVEMLDIRTKNWMYYPANGGFKLFDSQIFESIFKL